MNIYVVVEGEKSTKKIYRSWIALVNPELSPVDYIYEIDQNNVFILAGFGQPYFLTRVDQAIKDVNQLEIIDRLVVSVDSEDQDLHSKSLELRDRVDRIGCRVEVRYVIQHFCLETWLSGNIHMFRKRPQDPELINYYELFDIRNNDPELLPNNPERSWNRSQFAYHYLRTGIRDVHGDRRSYTKKSPGIVVREGYFNQVRKRCLEVQHIKSFEHFLNAFI